MNSPAPDQNPPSQKISIHPTTILLVEEDESVRLLTSQALARWKYDVLIASNAQHALELWKLHSHRIELLVTDVKMRGLDGPGLAEILVTENPKLKVVFTSGGYNEKVQLMVAEREHTIFLPKPFTIERLALALQTVMRAPAS